jgi:hypothetical protein
MAHELISHRLRNMLLDYVAGSSVLREIENEFDAGGVARRSATLDWFDPRACCGVEMLKEDRIGKLLDKFVDGTSTAFPVSIVINHYHPIFDYFRVEELQTEFRRLIPIPIQPEQRNRRQVLHVGGQGIQVSHLHS